ncbi:hypothetical protein LTR56_003491 [Elasticomyces elasticus]|nr:hypothetical protein LTR22_010967 [Elasticomyces elasticus]KAK3655484.1 hypothetical protein LTR56_003491 [Elasticomyces elasticus]KAK4919879.1 hypothetical protein LTR49_012476 [Elasticomyces elasticus]KAK5756739.1 hypothetical protein LTS12_013203 [Elasticomyces elasticus]
MKISLLVASVLPLFATSTPLNSRAGGPFFVPIPANCTIINPLPHAGCGIANVHGYMPNRNFHKNHLLHEAYFSTYRNESAEARGCQEQCYGLGFGRGCKSALVAYHVESSIGYYGSTTVGMSPTACLLYDAYLDPSKFVAAPKGQYVNETAGSLYCPL